MKRVAVIGCGWFGLPLAKALSASGVEVIGTKTTVEGLQALSDAGIEARQLQLGMPESEQRLMSILQNVDALVVNIPPGLRRGNQDYLEKLSLLVRPIEQSTLQLIIYVSSTGAYPQQQGRLGEDDIVVAEPNSSADILQQAERLMEGLTTETRRVVTVRFAGLVGAGRNPGRFLAGKTDLPGGSNLVNLVHLEDCISAVTALLHTKQSHTFYNIVSPAHPRKDQFYRQAAHMLGLPEPHFAENSQGEGKVVLGDRITEELDFEYQYRDPKALLS